MDRTRFRPLSGIKPHQWALGISNSDAPYPNVSDPSRGLSLINSIDIYIYLQQEHAIARSSKTNRLQLNKQIDTTISSFFDKFTKNHRTTSTCQFIYSYFILRVKIFF